MSKMSSLALAPALTSLAMLAACSGGEGHYHVNKHPATLGEVVEAILPAMRKPPLPVSDPNNPELAQEVIVEDPNDPMTAEKTVLEAHGQEWIFPGNNQDQSLRVHWVNPDMNFDDTSDFEVHIEVRAPYPKTIGGQQVMVTQQLADQRIQAAVSQMVDTVNAESWRQIRDDPKGPGAPLVAALRDLVPWDQPQSSSSNPSSG